jgi:hypothetical protein
MPLANPFSPEALMYRQLFALVALSGGLTLACGDEQNSPMSPTTESVAHSVERSTVPLGFALTTAATFSSLA